MKITIGTETYTKIDGLNFAPQTDITGGKLPLNEFSCDIITEDDIDAGTTAYLYDDRNTLWAQYRLTYSEHKDTCTVEIRGRSTLTFLDRDELPAVMYSAKSVQTLIGELFGTVSYTLDSSFSSETVTGFCPKQTARQRLQWICFVIGAYVKTFFSDKVEILPVDTAESTIPMNKIFWKPSIVYNDHVTAIRVTAYSFTQGTPQSVDTWVTDGTDYYIQTAQEFTISNPNAPVSAPANEVKFEGITLINSANVSDVLTLLSTYYFKRIEADLDVINNGDFLPGDKVLASLDQETMVRGYISQCTFSFGLQARSTIHIVQTDTVESGNLTIRYLYNNLQIGSSVYLFPVGYAYSISNPYIDQTVGSIRRVYRPQEENATGTIAAGGTTDTENYDVALEFKDGILRIYSVDDLTQNDGVVSIS